jgi:hypothetical protein
MTIMVSQRAELGAEVMRAKFPDGLLDGEVEVAGYALPQIAFPDGRSAVAVVDKIEAVLVKLVRRFEVLV